MDYLYENLGEKRFQEFCSVLISKEFQNIQAFPVGQPDGGRDTLAYNMSLNRKDFIVFQVKFVENANIEKDIHKWFTSIIKGEAEKINALIERGAKGYYLLTNVRGTAHLDAGSKDKVNKILEEEIKVPAICWWRDDISRFFEKDIILKWSFPEILNGQDVLNSILFENLNENKERRQSVITAYLTDQYQIDSEVKFKQIDLQNRLLNLFIDVPVRVKKINPKDRSLMNTLSSFEFGTRLYLNHDRYPDDTDNNIGAAAFFLHNKIQGSIERLLLEGGPGQGKSTISQYICQVHRVRLLNKTDEVNLLSNGIKQTPVRLPFKIDLRDVATWIEDKNPYEDFVNIENIGKQKKSLESFLIAHICYHSKIEEFTTAYFIAICKISPILFVFDGFDEIANIKVRGEVIEFINRGITRISGNTKSIQVIITSRPAAFSDSVGFQIENYPHFELIDITPVIIDEYVEKWIKASKLDNRDAKELRILMREKLSMPHLKDLAKSPMQLAIFISLLKTKGKALPNKRTSLYDNYISLVFDRESTKHPLIRDKRDLIINIHQYLAWVLHSEAESIKSNGSISVTDLHTKLNEYLIKEEHDISITSELFTVMKERVCALVSRVQGTFEFEVQPLREYFCARYLYETAPYSPTGSEKKGTKVDRLHAILRNFYWQNVVRFFTGCADVGELDMIIQELTDLQNDSSLSYTNYPRIITSQVLSDYVFSQKPNKLKDVIKIIVSGINIGDIINQNYRSTSNEPYQLPYDCGRKEIFEESFQQLTSFPNNDYAGELIGIINNNSIDILDRWQEFSKTLFGGQLTKWIEYALKLGLIHQLKEKQMVAFLEEKDEAEYKKRLQLMINGNGYGILVKDLAIKRKMLESILNSELMVMHRSTNESGLHLLNIVFHPFILSKLLDKSFTNATFLDHIDQFRNSRNWRTSFAASVPELQVNDDVDVIISHFMDSLKEIWKTPAENFKNSILPWDLLIETARGIFKDSWCMYIAATIAAGIKSKDATYDEFGDLNDSKLSLSRRTRSARMKSGNSRFWENQMDSQENILFTLLVFFTWATPKTIFQLLPVVSLKVNELNIKDFLQLSESLSSTVANSIFDKLQQNFIHQEIKKKVVPDEIKYLLSFRFDSNTSKEFIYNNIEQCEEKLKNIQGIKFNYLIGIYLRDTQRQDVLENIRNMYKSIDAFDDRDFGELHSNRRIEIPYDLAKTIMKDCRNYPRVISSLAEKAMRSYASRKIIPIGEIAIRDNWFANN